MEDPLRVINVQKTALWPSEEPRVVLDGISFGGGVHHAEHGLYVILQQLLSHFSPWTCYDVGGGLPRVILSITYLVVQHLILFLQRGQKRILGQVIRLREVLLVGSFGLFLQCLDILR